ALLYPVLPDSAVRIWEQLGMTEPIDKLSFDNLRWGQLPTGQKIGQVSGIFPRIDLKEAVDKMRKLEEEVSAEQSKLLGKPVAPKAQEGVTPLAAPIAIDDFVKVDLRVGQVVSAERVKGADKLLHLKVDIAEPEPRTIVAGIAEAYQPDQLLGRK